MIKITSDSDLKKILNKFFIRGQITFNNFEDAMIFKESLDYLEIKRTEKIIDKNVIFTLCWFFPNYIHENCSPESCFSFN